MTHAAESHGTGEATGISGTHRGRAWLDGRYRTIAEIGKGGMAVVQLAVAKGPGGFNKLVVLKLLRDDVSNVPEIAEMFRREARLAARLSHPNVVQTFEVSGEGTSQFMVLEFLDGQPFSSVLRGAAHAGRQLPLGHALRVLCETLAGLHYIHEATDFGGTPLGIVHRDVSPQNVFVTYDGQVKVLDFGIAKLDNRSAEQQTEIGVVKGKIRYMAPEQMAGDGIDRRVDVFAVGVMLWECVAGKKLWGDEPELRVMNRLANGELPSLREHAPDAPDALERVCTKALAFAPADRYATAAEFQADLERATEALQLSVKARDVGQLVAELFAEKRAEMQAIIRASIGEGTIRTLPPDPGARADQTTEVATPAARLAAHRLRWLWGAGLVLLVVVAGLLWRVSGSTSQKPVPSADASVSAPVSEAPSAVAPQGPVQPDMVRLQVSSSPAEARLFLDGVVLTSNPYDGTVRRDAEKHTLRAEAPGYASKSLEVSFLEAATLSLALERSPSKAPPGTAPIQATRPPRAAPTGASPRPPDCADPWFLDAHGIKHVRTECIR